MLDLVPLAGARRKVADVDRETEFVGEPFKLGLPDAVGGRCYHLHRRWMVTAVHAQGRQRALIPRQRTQVEAARSIVADRGRSDDRELAKQRADRPSCRGPDLRARSRRSRRSRDRRSRRTTGDAARDHRSGSACGARLRARGSGRQRQSGRARPQPPSRSRSRSSSRSADRRLWSGSAGRLRRYRSDRRVLPCLRSMSRQARGVRGAFGPI